MDIGEVAISALAKFQVSYLVKMEFRIDNIKFLADKVLKLREGGPFKYKLRRASSCFVLLTILCEAKVGKLAMREYMRVGLVA